MNKIRMKKNINKTISLIILSFLALLAFIPLYWMVVTAFKEPSLTLKFPPEIFPKNPTLQNFESLFQRKEIFRWTLNSVIVAGTVTLTQILFCAMAGYAIAKKKFPGSQIFFWIYISSMMIPKQVTLVPLYIMVANLGMINTYWGLILPSIAAPFGVFLMRQFMLSLPNEILDAARIDGAGEFKTFRKIVLPMSKPALAVLGIFTFVGEWNSFLWPLIVTQTSEMKTLQAGLALIQEEVPMEYAYLMAGATYAAIPMVIVFLSFQKYFLRGVTVGAVK
ncbi:MAG TPA: carbohydrate ABC transporter permease [Thermotogota bacterium]|nr:carbohydrate ABC transporter permease [Thermotogota bacterium]HPJ87501.1 carbohydrate ABC transporter permease [Thermotogota bacterium]HPR94706.1 carbohydrate ABC transporter permease [Thermotogota bacterium]